MGVLVRCPHTFGHISSVYIRGSLYCRGNPDVKPGGHGEGERRKAECFGQGRSLESEALCCGSGRRSNTGVRYSDTREASVVPALVLFK